MIMEQVLAAALPHLANRTINDLVVGISLVAVELDNGAVGVAYTLRDNLPNGCSVFFYAPSLLGAPAEKPAAWCVGNGDGLQHSIASAVLAAASCGLKIADDSKDGLPFGLSVAPEETIGMIGFLPPIATALKQAGGKLVVFDEGLAHLAPGGLIYPTEQQSELLPECDIVILSGTTTSNGTIDGLLAMCRKAREIVMVGASTPMFAAGWRGSGVTRLAGSWWDNNSKEEIFKAISLAGGIGAVGKYMRKKLALVE